MVGPDGPAGRGVLGRRKAVTAAVLLETDIMKTTLTCHLASVLLLAACCAAASAAARADKPPQRPRSLESTQDMKSFDQAIGKIEAFADRLTPGPQKQATQDQPAEGKGKYIDIHIHANAWSDKGFNLEKVCEWMKQKDVVRCIVQYGIEMPRNDEERKRSVENFRKHRGKIDWFCRILPEDVTSTKQAVEILTGMKRDGAIGFGEHYGKGLAFDDPNCVRLYEACAEVGLPILFHMDGGNNKDEKGLPRLENVVKSHPNCIFIAHGPGWWSNIRGGEQGGQAGKPAGNDAPGGTLDRLLRKYPNLYGDLSAGSGAGAIGGDKEFGRAFLIRNADKLMFGTDIGPWGGDAKQFTLFEGLDIPADVKARIYRQNAERLFGFTDHQAPETPHGSKGARDEEQPPGQT
jgi:hypothetical protein